MPFHNQPVLSQDCSKAGTRELTKASVYAPTLAQYYAAPKNPNRSYRRTAAKAGTHELTKSKRLCSNPRIVLYRSKKSQPVLSQDCSNKAGTRELTKSKRLCSNPRIVLYRSKKIPTSPTVRLQKSWYPQAYKVSTLCFPPTHSIMLLQQKNHEKTFKTVLNVKRV